MGLRSSDHVHRVERILLRIAARAIAQRLGIHGQTIAPFAASLLRGVSGAVLAGDGEGFTLWYLDANTAQRTTAKPFHGKRTIP